MSYIESMAENFIKRCSMKIYICISLALNGDGIETQDQCVYLWRRGI
jgi:hypothetical protein